jgi:hypothetical protein
MGGLVEAVCLQPVDTIKTRLQLDNAGKYRGQNTSSIAWTVFGL